MLRPHASREALKPLSPPRLCVSARIYRCGCAALERSGGHDLGDTKGFAPSRETLLLSASKIAPAICDSPARRGEDLVCG